MDAIHSMTALAYDKVRVYHEKHGDDYGSRQSREKKYRAVRSLLPAKSGKTLLDVGCGTRQFRHWVPNLDYTGIDLIYGQNVMDETRHFDVVICNGCVYKLPSERAAKSLLYHCWTLADEAFVWTSLNRCGMASVTELVLDPHEMFRWACKLAGAGRVKLDASYLAHDFAIGMYK